MVVRGYYRNGISQDIGRLIMGLDISGIGAGLTAIDDIIGKVLPDKTQAEKDAASLALQRAMSEQNLQLAQVDVNKTEAGSIQWFIAGWRPFVGWVGGLSLAYAAILEPFMRFCAMQWGYRGAFPVIDTNITLQVLLGLLGLGTLRTFEKSQNTEGNRT